MSFEGTRSVPATEEQTNRCVRGACRQGRLQQPIIRPSQRKGRASAYQQREPFQTALTMPMPHFRIPKQLHGICRDSRRHHAQLAGVREFAGGLHVVVLLPG